MKLLSPAAVTLTALALLLPWSSVGIAQSRQRPMPPGLEDLPVGLAPWEVVPGESSRMLPVTAPFGPMRAAAEWDESRGVFCMWDNASLMNELRRDNEVHIITQNQSWWLSWLSSNGIPSTNFRFFNAQTNTWWVRDYGPWFVWDGAQDFGLVDYTYNRPRPYDDAIPAALAAAYGIPYHGMDLIHTGGNFYTDGYGTDLSTTLVFTENPGKTQAQVRASLETYLGITRSIHPLIPVDIQHIDTFGKPLAPDTLVWGLFPENSTAWVYTEAALLQLQRLQSPYGWPYEIHRLPVWPQGSSWSAYINSFQTNGKLVVAAHGTANDSQARAIYEAAAPGYQVALVSAGGTTWGDSVHCRTRNFMRGDGLRIYAYPHWKRSDDQIQGYPVRAEVFPAPGERVAGSPRINWSVSGGPPWMQLDMSPTARPFEYEATLPAVAHGTTVTYFLEAQDTAGNSRSAPPVAPAGTFTIAVEPDAAPPTLIHTPPHQVRPIDWPLELVCTALDDTGIPDVVLEYRVNGVSRPAVTMVQDAGTFDFRGSMAGSVGLGDLIAYRIVASDQASPVNSIASPQQGWHWVTVDARRSVIVIERDPTPSSGQLWADWCSALGFDAQLVTSWPSSLSGHDLAVICLGMSPANANLSSSQANALVSFLNSGGAAFVEGGNAWSQGSSSIYRAYFGVGAASNGATLTAPLLGVGGEVSAGMSFVYVGEKNASDHLTPAAGARPLLTAGGLVKAVLNSTGTYRAAGASFQLGGLVDAAAPTRAKYLAGLVLEHLGLDVDLIVTADPAIPQRLTFDVVGDPGKTFGIFCSPGTGYTPIASAGILRLHRPTTQMLGGGTFPGSGRARVELDLPAGAFAPGTELHFQVYARSAGAAGFHLTNADRLVLGG